MRACVSLRPHRLWNASRSGSSNTSPSPETGSGAFWTQKAHIVICSLLKYFTWDNAKNEKLKVERGISFEEVVFHIERGDVLDIVEHPNQERYRGQRVIVVQIEQYAYLVPCVEQDEYVVLKTVIPSRKATRQYIQGGR